MHFKKKGFTLIELIVVMAILAILVMIAAGAYLGYTKKAQQTRLMHDARLVEDAVERYHLDHGEFPIDESRPIKGRDLVDPRDKNWNPVTPDPDKDYYPIDEDKIDDYVNIGTDPDNFYDTDEKCLVVQKAADDDIFSFNIVPRRKNARSGMLSGSDVKGLVEWLKEKEIYGRYLIKYDKTKDVWKSTESI